MAVYVITECLAPPLPNTSRRCVGRQQLRVRPRLFRHLSNPREGMGAARYLAVALWQDWPIGLRGFENAKPYSSTEWPVRLRRLGAKVAPLPIPAEILSCATIETAGRGPVTRPRVGGTARIHAVRTWVRAGLAPMLMPSPDASLTWGPHCYD